jgi:hypothetical protein
MKRIEIRQELGSEIVTREDGRKLREIVEVALSDHPVTIDFGGLQINSVSFFDEAFGQLALRCGEEEINRKIRFEGLDRFDAALLHDIISSRTREAQKRKRAAS